jgi:hypothetical protein
MTDKPHLITQLRDIFQRWEEFLTGLPEAQISAPDRIGRLSIKDIVAHLTAWQQLSVARLQAAVDDRDPVYPDWPPELDRDAEDVDALNAWFYEQYSQRSWAEVHREWSSRFLRFIELCEAVPEADLTVTGRFAWLEDYPLSAVLEGTHEHHTEHLEPLMVIFKTNGKG